MSRTSTAGAAPQTAKTIHASTATQPPMTLACAPADKVAARAYEKWLKGGCKHGNDKKDWLDAEMEIKAEMARNAKK